MAEAPKEKSTPFRSLKTMRRLGRLFRTMWGEGHDASAQGKPVIYCFVSCMLEEIVRAMDMVPIWPENWAAACAVMQDAERFLNKAQAAGFSDKLCTYATCGLGFQVMRHELGEIPPNSPFGGLEKPNAMLGVGLMACDARHKWYQTVQRYMDVPLHTLGVMIPPWDADLKQVEGYYVDYMVEELRETVQFLERVTGRKMNWDELNRRIDLSDETVRVWFEAYELRKAVPTPMPAQDAMMTIGPGFLMLATEETLDFFQNLYDEIKYRVENKIGAIPDEKYRILWGMGLPPWFALELFNYFESHGAVFPIEAISRPFDPVEIPAGVTHPLERLAWRTYRRFTYRYEKARKHTGHPAVELLIELIDDYKIDALLVNRAFSCRPIHTGQLHQLAVLKQYRNLPTLVLENDMVDASSFSAEDVKNKIETFIEVVDASKRK